MIKQRSEYEIPMDIWDNISYDKDQYAKIVLHYLEEDNDILEHYGTPRHSGRYPWGSGENPYQRNQSFIGHVYELRSQGMSDVEIARGMGITTTVLRARISVARSEIRKEDVAHAIDLKDKGYSNAAIAREMGIAESSVRSLLNPAAKERTEQTRVVADQLKAKVDQGVYLDVGSGVEYQFGITETKLAVAVNLLEEEGYSVHTIQEEQPGTGQMTKIKILAPPGTTTKDIYNNRDKIGLYVDVYSEDGGKTFQGIEPPKAVDPSRVAVVYDEKGGGDKDGVIELRRGVDDISLGDAQYAQVRIQIGRASCRERV